MGGRGSKPRPGRRGQQGGQQGGEGPQWSGGAPGHEAYPWAHIYPPVHPLIPIWRCPALERSKEAFLAACGPGGLAELPPIVRLEVWREVTLKPEAPTDPCFGDDWRSCDFSRHVIDNTLLTFLYQKVIVDGELDIMGVEYDEEQEKHALAYLKGQGAYRPNFSGSHDDITMYRYSGPDHLLPMLRVTSYILKTLMGA